MIRPFLEQGLSEMGASLPEGCLRQLELFAAEMKKWNRKVNLTAIRDDADIAVKHIVDSLAVGRFIKAGERLLDVGSGAGLPAIPLKIAYPDIKVVSVDAVGKKINFQRHVARLLAFKDFEALHCRVEELYPSHGGCFDVIVSRAFSSLELFVSLAAPLLKEQGRLIAMKGPGVGSELGHAAAGLRSLGFEVVSQHAYSLPLNMGERNLVTIAALNARK